MSGDKCFQCGKSMTCDPRECWCFDMPQILPLNIEKGCLCQECSQKKIVQQIRNYIENLTPEKRRVIKSLGVAKKLYEGVDYYINEEGNFVFTKWYHLRRGYCCQSGCINCGWK